MSAGVKGLTHAVGVNMGAAVSLWAVPFLPSNETYDGKMLANIASLIWKDVGETKENYEAQLAKMKEYITAAGVRESNPSNFTGDNRAKYTRYAVRGWGRPYYSNGSGGFRVVASASR